MPTSYLSRYVCHIHRQDFGRIAVKLNIYPLRIQQMSKANMLAADSERQFVSCAREYAIPSFQKKAGGSFMPVYRC